MASALVNRRQMNRSISVYEATRQFDLLFDEYFEITQSASSIRPHMVFARVAADGGYDQLETAGSAAQEVDEVCTDSQTDPEQKETIHEIAKELAKLGDQYSEQFGNDLVKVDSVLTSLFTQASGLEYQTFKNTLESIMSHDKNAADFVFMMCLSNKVVSNVGHVANKAKSYFRRYIGNSYIEVVAESGGMQQFIGQT